MSAELAQKTALGFAVIRARCQLLSSKVAHYKAKKWKVPHESVHTNRHKNAKFSFAFLCLCICALMNEQRVVRSLDSHRSEVEFLTIQENLDERGAFELALNQGF